MSTPSLLNIPYLYKAGTLYSQIPESGAGDFTVSRTTTVANRSTRINKDGFIETVLDNVPRLDYPLGGAVNGCPALLVEPSAQNLVLRSQEFNTGWTNVSNNLSISANVTSTLDPAGGNTADLLTVVSGSTQSQLSQDITTVSGTAYVFSFFGKKGSGATELNSFRIFGSSIISSLTINWDTGVITHTAGSGATSQNFGNGWWRIVIPFTANSTTTTVQVVTFTTYATALSSLRWGAQLETGSVATSYIPTTTAAVTRSADVISDTTATALIGQTEGTIYAEVDVSRVNTGPMITISDGTDGNRIQISLLSSTQLNATIRVATANANYQVTIPTVPATGGIYKMALGYKANDYCFALNGITYASAASRGVPACSTLGLGTTATQSGFFNDRIRAIELHPNRLSNAQLATLTAL